MFPRKPGAPERLNAAQPLFCRHLVTVLGPSGPEKFSVVCSGWPGICIVSGAPIHQ